MPNLPAALLFVSAILSAALVFAETPVPDSGSGPAPAGVSETAVPPVESRMRIEVRDDLLSIDLVDAEFGGVMKAISARAGIKVDMSGAIQQKRLTTKFSGIELERGIIRLMTLMKEKNYTMTYDTRGRVSAVEVYSIEQEAASPARAHSRPEMKKTLKSSSAPEQPVPGVQKNPPQQRRLIPPLKPAAISTERSKKIAAESEDEGEEDVEELPYIAPQKKMPAGAKQQ